MSAEIRYLPAVRRLPEVAPPPVETASTPRRLLRLATALGAGSVVLTGAGLGFWQTLGGEGGAGRGPWPLLLAIAFSFGLLGAGCCITALCEGRVSRREALAALCISLVAPLAVGVLALALFFASVSFSLGA